MTRRPQTLRRPTSYYVVDGFDLRVEMMRLVALGTFASTDMLRNPPTLEVARFNRPVRKRGHASNGRHIKINVGTNVDRYNLQETLAHELTHIYYHRRGDLWLAHQDLFWKKLDIVVREAYGSDLRFEPRSNRGHGRYAKALRQRDLLRNSGNAVEAIDALLSTGADATLVGRWQDAEPGRYVPNYFIDPNEPRELTEQEQAFLEGTPPEPYERPETVGWGWMPGSKEPTDSIRDYLPGWAFQTEEELRVAEVPAVRLVSTGLSHNPRTRAEELDERVYAIISRFPGSERWFIDHQYRRQFGDRYPGASTYNSIWRLKKAGRVYRSGQRWYLP